jgi:pimeloyl-ACP methyl ester carboxylesterase
MSQTQTVRIPSGGAELFARANGSGPAVMCLHAGVADHRMFAAQLDGLADAARVVAYDRRGFGRTTTPDEPFSHVDDLGAVMDACGVGTAVLLGCSQGGRIAIDFALARPERVSGLFLVAPVVSGMPAPALPPDLRALDEAIDRAYEVEDLGRIAALELRAWLDGPRSRPGRVAGPPRDLFTAMNERILAHPELDGERAPADAWTRLEEIRAPARILCGDLDFPHMADLARTIAARMPGAALVPLRGVAHMPMLERPDAMTAEVRAFLDGLG